MTALWLLRHAPVEAAPGLCYGATDLLADAALTRAAAQRIAPLLPKGMAIRVSPLRRCTALADAIAAQRPDLAPQVDARLAEMDFGAWEGQPWSAIDRAQLGAWTADFADHRPGGGESVRAFMQRVAAAWDAWRDEGGEALWITHAGVMRAAMLLHAGIRCPRGAAEWPAEALPFGEWRRLAPAA